MAAWVSSCTKTSAALISLVLAAFRVFTFTLIPFVREKEPPLRLAAVLIATAISGRAFSGWLTMSVNSFFSSARCVESVFTASSSLSSSKSLVIASTL